MSKDTIEIANELLAEKSALEARVKVLGVENLALRESLDAAEAELERLKAQEPVGYIDPESLREYRGVRAGGSWSHSVKTGEYNQTMPIYAEPRPAVPQRLVVKLPEICWHSGANYDREEVIEAIKAAGGEIAE